IRPRSPIRIRSPAPAVGYGCRAPEPAEAEAERPALPRRVRDRRCISVSDWIAVPDGTGPRIVVIAGAVDDNTGHRIQIGALVSGRIADVDRVAADRIDPYERHEVQRRAGRNGVD